MLLEKREIIQLFYYRDQETFLKEFRENKDTLIFWEEISLADDSKQLNLFEIFPLPETLKIKQKLWHFNAYLIALHLDYNQETKQVVGESIPLTSLLKVTYHLENCFAEVIGL